MSDERLIAIEAKIDKLSEAMLTLVRMEERMMFQATSIEKLEQRVEDLIKEKSVLANKVQTVAAAENLSNGRNMIFERIIWLLVSATMGYAGLKMSGVP